jgi:uncharacterized protein YbjT (DUF2867 family)
VTILVTGATGNVGRQVVKQLVESGAQVRAMTRNPATANLPDGVEVVQGDLTQPETIPSALAGVERAFLFPIPGAFVDLAKAAGVQRIVTLTSAGMDDSLEYDPHYLNEQAVERAVEVSGLEWTHIRPGEFMANTLEWAAAIHTEGVVRAPFGKTPGVPIHEADIAAVAVAALLEDGHHAMKYSLTGPEVITTAGKVAAIGAALGREVRFVELTPEEARVHWRASGYPDDVIDWLLGVDSDWGDYVPAVLPTVKKITGRPARTFYQWAVDHVQDFR